MAGRPGATVEATRLAAPAADVKPAERGEGRALVRAQQYDRHRRLDDRRAADGLRRRQRIELVDGCGDPVVEIDPPLGLLDFAGCPAGYALGDGWSGRLAVAPSI